MNHNIYTITYNVSGKHSIVSGTFTVDVLAFMYNHNINEIKEFVRNVVRIANDRQQIATKMMEEVSEQKKEEEKMLDCMREQPSRIGKMQIKDQERTVKKFTRMIEALQPYC